MNSLVRSWLLSGASLIALTVADHDGDDKYKIDETELTVRLPKPFSDHTATLVGSTVYLAGGCDDPSGNTLNAVSGYFECGSVSKSFYSLDLASVNGTSSDDFVVLTDMPLARFRHAAAAANGQIWIHGGRTLLDQIVEDIHVYDIASNTWSIVTGLDDKYLLSDHTGFSFQDFVYFAGGYDANYTAFGTTFRIDASAATLDSTTPTTVEVEEMATMDVERGDVAAASTDNYAIVGGGFTHANGFCEPHVHAEQYSFADDTWTEIEGLTYGGAERVLVSVGEKVFAIGGERQIEGLCDLSADEQPEPGEQTIALDLVERYDVGVNHWTILSSLPDHRFRFAAVGYQDMMFAFGGQLKYEDACRCFKTINVVTVYEEVMDQSAAFSFWSGSTILLGTVLASLLAWM